MHPSRPLPSPARCTISGLISRRQPCCGIFGLEDTSTITMRRKKLTWGAAIPTDPGPARMVSSRSARKARNAASNAITGADTCLRRGSGYSRTSSTAIALPDHCVEGSDTYLDTTGAQRCDGVLHPRNTFGRMAVDEHDVDRPFGGSADIGVEIENIKAGASQYRRHLRDNAGAVGAMHRHLHIWFNMLMQLAMNGVEVQAQIECIGYRTHPS